MGYQHTSQDFERAAIGPGNFSLSYESEKLFLRIYFITMISALVLPSIKQIWYDYYEMAWVFIDDGWEKKNED